jgi:hypothetical protein
VETGDRQTEDVSGVTRSEANVVPFPRDWLGPPEELVPLGRPSRGHTTEPNPDDELPPAAEAFWSEDSAALHDAVQAPAVSLDAPSVPASRSRGSRGSRGSLSGLKLALAGVAAVVLVVLAVIGTTERAPGTKPASIHHHLPAAGLNAGVQFESAISTVLRQGAKSVLAAHQIDRAHSRPVDAHSPPVEHHARARHSPHIATVRHLVSHAATVVPSPSSDVAAGTPVTGATPAPTDTGSATSSTSDHTATSAPTTAFGANGLLGPGSSPTS